MATKNIVPRTDGEGKLGIDSKRWDSIVVNSVSASSITASGNLLVEGDTTINGNLTFGNADTDSINFGAEVSSSIIPDAAITYDLGSSTKPWRHLYIGSSSIQFAGGSLISGSDIDNLRSGTSLSTNFNVQGYITAGGNISGSSISSSGNLHVGNDIYGGATKRLTLGATNVFVGNISSSGDLYIGGNDIYDSSVTKRLSIGSTLEVVGNISASGAITSSGLLAVGRPGRSGDISASGFIRATGHLYASASIIGPFGTVTSSAQLTVEGSISASGGISASYLIVNELRSTGSVIDFRNLPTSDSSAGTGELYTLSGSQIFSGSAELSGVGGIYNAYTSSKFVLIK